MTIANFSVQPESYCATVFFWSVVFVDLSMSAGLSNKKKKNR